MHIVIDAYQMSPHVTGTDRRARNVLIALQRLDESHTYTILVNKDVPYIADIVNASGFRLLPIHVAHRALWFGSGLPHLLCRLQADVFFSFHNLAAPVFKSCRTIVSLLDMIPFVYQRQYYSGISGWWFRRPLVLGLMRLAARKGDAFLAISSFTSEDAVTRLGIDRASIMVAPLQAESRFLTVVPPSDLRTVRERYQLPEQFVFTLGSAEPRKNAAGLVSAHRMLPGSLRKQYPLVIGGSRWHDTTLPIEGDTAIRLSGYIEDDDLPAVYQAASCFAWPTMYEGFGLPVLEAMACGTPVVTSNSTSIPEVAGDAAVLVDPHDPEALAKALESVLCDQELRGSLITRGRERVKQFSWKDSAEALLRMFEDGQSPSTRR